MNKITIKQFVEIIEKIYALCNNEQEFALAVGKTYDAITK